MYDIHLTQQAKKDSILIYRTGLKNKVIELINIICFDPFKKPPPYESLKGDRKGAYSRRINKKHRLVYEVLPNTDNAVDANGEPFTGIIKIIRMWTHYE